MLYTPNCPGDDREKLLKLLNRPMHYLHMSELLCDLHEHHGVTLAELSRRCGVPVAAVVSRMALMNLEEPLRTELTAAHAPEGIASALLRLPDEVSRMRLARRILRDRLCIRDALLLVDAALRHMPVSQPFQPHQPLAPHRGRVINLVRDPRPYLNALRDITGQMTSAGVRVTIREERVDGCMRLTVDVPVRRRRTERYLHLQSV